MRIVDVCAFYSPTGGGVRTYIDRKLAAAEANRVEIVVLVPGERAAVEHRGLAASIVYVPSPVFPLDRNYRYFDDDAALLRALDDARPDFVEVSSPWRSAETIARWCGSAPRALVMHADPLSAYAYRWFGPALSREAIDRGFGWYWRKLRRLDAAYDLVVAANSDLTGRLQAGGLRAVETIPMGIEAGRFGPQHRDEALRAELLARCKLPPSAALLIGVGRLAPEKRWPMIVDACTAAACRRPVGLVIVGDGRERAKILRYIDENPHVHVLQRVEDRAVMARLMASADALIHGCEAETFGLSAAEARASGLPVIAPDRGGAADQARCGGELFAATNAADATRAILRLVSRLPLARADAAASAPHVRTMDKHFDALFARYAEIVGSRWQCAA